MFFFSPVHQTYSRIDFFLIDQRILQLVKLCTYESIVISDHSPVVLELRFKDKAPFQKNWQFNPSLLSDDNFVEFINSQIDFFLETNKLPETNVLILWETLKAYIRGHIIEYTARLKKNRYKKFNELTKLIQEVDMLDSSAPSPDLRKKRIALQTEFDLLVSNETSEKFMKTRQNYYEHGERAGRLLSHQLRQYSAANFITEIHTADGERKSDCKDINDQFKLFYSSLYSSDCSPDSDFLDNLTLPTITDADRAL